MVRSTITDGYVKMGKNTKFCRGVAERIGPGFDLPKIETVEVIPNVPSSYEMEIAISI